MTVPLAEVDLLPGVGAWFTTARAGNLSHRRPHQPLLLAAARRAVRQAAGVSSLHLMRQVHGADVGRVTAATVPGAEVRGVDALVTAEPERALAVQVADCVPVLLASTDGPVGVVHAGRRGLEAGVIDAALHALAVEPATVHAAIGPAIGGCCYEVPTALHDEVVAKHPVASATTTWGTTSLDLPAAASAAFEERGVATITPTPGCTRCDPEGRWFSHRADPNAGRQLGIVVRRGG
ncbi:MAG: polyphenol oxidase family protein [Actinobacteria bacterium]|nr:polyphenol oxidase family protein [Actinomycetota bacterium]